MSLFFDATIAACCADELDRRLRGARVREVYQPGRLELCLEFESGQSERFLVASANAQWARVHLARRRPRGASKRASPFLLFARKHLRHARVESVAAEPFDRIVRVALQSASGGLPNPVRSMVCEIMGKHSNIVFLSDGEEILEAIKHIPPALSRFRTVLPHAAYAPPPPPVGQDPRTISPEDLAASVADRARRADTLAEALRGAVAGFSRTLAEEMAVRAGFEPFASPSEIGADGWERVAREIGHWAEQVVSGRFEPIRIIGDPGFPRYYAFPLHSLARSATYQPVESLGLEVERAAEEERARQRIATVRSGLSQSLRREIDGLQERIGELSSQIVRPEEADRLRRCGEAILIHLSRIEPGLSRVVVEDPYTGEPLEIALRPEWPPQKNAEDYFKRHRAARRRAEIVPQLIAEAEARLDHCTNLLDRVEQAQGEEELRQAARTAAEMGIRLPAPVRSEEEPPSRARRREGSAQAQVLRLTSSDGYSILAGRSAEQNEWLLRDGSGPEDYWFHARDIHGGHVIVLTGRRPERVPRSTLEEAASIAAALSKSRHSALVPVDYTLRKYVRKAKKGPPGKVIYEREKTLMVQPKSPRGE